jgi:hypothetical protein
LKRASRVCMFSNRLYETSTSLYIQTSRGQYA